MTERTPNHTNGCSCWVVSIQWLIGEPSRKPLPPSVLAQMLIAPSQLLYEEYAC